MTVQEPTTKKRKLDIPSQKGLEAQPSFTEVLEQLEAEEDAAGSEYLPVKLDTAVANWYSVDSIETSASWPRPPVLPFDAEKETIC